MLRARQSIVQLLVVVGLATLSLVAITVPAQAVDKGRSIGRGERLNYDDFIRRPAYDGYYKLLMQRDGNLVLYITGPNPDRACWASNTVGRGRHAIYQGDGNFVVYDGAGRATWASNTVGVPGQNVNINSRGRVYVGYRPISGECR